MPDRMFVLLKKNFPELRGTMNKAVREFEKPTFRPGKEASIRDGSRYKRQKLKKNNQNLHPKVRAQLRLI
jgi:hypothetical protein